jgi:hypothetical protein
MEHLGPTPAGAGVFFMPAVAYSGTLIVSSRTMAAMEASRAA